MERKYTYDFSDEELKYMAEALAMYAGYTKEMDVNMLLGDESDAEDVYREHNQVMKLFREMFEESNGERFEVVADELSAHLGRPVDVNDFSKYDWFKHVRE